MTPQYIFEDMTWNEISSALDFVYRYEVNERHWKGPVKLNEWIYKNRDTVQKDLKAISDGLRKKG